MARRLPLHWLFGALLVLLAAIVVGLRWWADSPPTPTHCVSGVCVGRRVIDHGGFRWSRYRVPIPTKESTQYTILRDDHDNYWLTPEFAGTIGERLDDVPAWPLPSEAIPATLQSPP